MNHHLKHPGAHQLTQNYHASEGAPRAHTGWPESNNRAAPAPESVVIPLSGAKAPAPAPRPNFTPYTDTSFASLSERIASQTGAHATSFESDEVFKPSGRSLSFSSVTEAVRAAWQNPQSLVTATLLALLVGFLVNLFVTG